MARIIAGYLEQQDQVEETIDQLVGAGFAKEKISSFFNNPPGQHDLYPIGGDEDQSPGAKKSTEGVVAGMTTGGVIGAVIGAAATPLTGPLGAMTGAFVGAHIGSLAGSMASMKEQGEREEEDDANTLPQRKSGMVVAVCVEDVTQENDVIHILQAQHAVQIERAEGTISDGNWIDFNPLTPPVPLTPTIQPGM